MLNGSRSGRCTLHTKRCVVASSFSTFGRIVAHAAVFQTVRYLQGMNPGGDIKYLAPEVVNSFLAAQAMGRGDVSYRKQPEWELANVMFELATNIDAWPGYPDAFVVDGVVKVDPRSLLPWLPAEYPVEVRDAIVALMHPDPERRMELSDAQSMLETLRRELWGVDCIPEHRFPVDESATGEWVAGRSIDGTFAMIPFDSDTPVLNLRDNMAARLALGRCEDPRLGTARSFQTCD